MKNAGTTPIWAKESPWLDESSQHLFRDEFRLLADISEQPEILSWGSYYTPIPIYEWIFTNKGIELLYRSLARFAPMFKVTAYKDQTALWISPPPSGKGNAIYLVIGFDCTGLLRSVGGNYFNEPKLQNTSTLESASFFKKYDSSGERERLELVRKTVIGSIKPEDKNLLANINYECEHFHTMVIYITVLTDSGSLFHAGKAVIEGVKPADFSYEFFGEIK